MANAGIYSQSAPHMYVFGSMFCHPRAWRGRQRDYCDGRDDWACAHLALELKKHFMLIWII
jgi:hypothetical protein